MREIRTEEITLIHYLLDCIQLNAKDYPFASQVDEYEGGKMGSINLGGNPEAYDGDLIQVRYVDIDHIPVIITLTKDKNNQLLDLDFWKEDFSKLIKYPETTALEILSI